MSAILHALFMGGGWLTALILMAARGHKDKTNPIPIITLFLNAAWQGTVLFFPTIGLFTKGIVFLWFAVSIVLIYQHFAQLKEASAFRKDGSLTAKYTALIVGAVVLNVLCHLNPELPDNNSGGFAAYAINMFMAVQFSFMILKRNSLKGQSLFIAIFKLLGSAGVYMFSFQSFLDNNHPYTIICGLATLAADVVYIGLIFAVAMRDNVNVFNPVYEKRGTPVPVR